MGWAEMEYKKINKIGTDVEGYLSVIESMKDIPFEVKRFYYIYGVPKMRKRGFHAHKKLEQYLFAINGKIRIYLDDGNVKESVLLSKPNEGVFIHKGVWREMEFVEKNSILCVLASHHYEEDDYIRDYDQFLDMVCQGYWKE